MGAVGRIVWAAPIPTTSTLSPLQLSPMRVYRLHNFKDFPAAKVPAAVEVMPPHQFARDAVSLAPARAVAAVQEIAGRSGSGRRATRSVEDIYDRLQNVYKMDAAVCHAS